MSEIVYSLKKRKDTDELHLFRAEPTKDGCIPEKKSICEKMKNSESQQKIFICHDEVEARIESAKKGRKVCGTCVSHLYSNY